MPVVPPSNPSDPHPPSGQGSVILSDVLNRDKSINIFAGFTHDIETAAIRLDDSGKNTTILAPLNSAVEALPRKPWEDPEDYNRLGTDAYVGDDGQERASRNLRRFVEAHLVPVSPWQENQKARTIGGDGEVWWENKDGTKFIQPGNIEVVSIASTVANGEVAFETPPHVEAGDLSTMSAKNMDDAEAFEADNRRRMAQETDDLERREREQDDRRRREGFPPAPPHHSNAGSIPIHQPVASRISGAIHSPGGLLANHGSAAPPMPLGAPSGPPANFGGPLQADQARPPQHGGPNNGPAQHQMFAPISHPTNPPNAHPGAPGGPPPIFGGPLQQREVSQALQQAPFGGGGGGGVGGGGANNNNPGAQPPPNQAQGGPGPGGGLAQGQQPILNDALTYLDQVKVQFHDQADVYNRFLDIMKDFKSQAIDTPGVINRVSELFAGHPNLIQGFNTFLPPGYRIECGTGSDPNTIRVTTPMGTTVQSITGRVTQPDGPHAQPGAAQPLFGPRNNGTGSWPQPQQPQLPQHSIESPEATFSTPVQNGAAAFGQAQGLGAPFDAQGPGHQRGPNQMPGNAPPVAGQPPRNAQTPTPQAGAPGVNGSAAQQAGLERRGPVEFNHAISYVNKIKNRFQDKPEIYKQFLEILQTYQREQKPIQEVYAQVTTLFHTAPDLLEDFKQFLPESAGQAKGTPGRAADEAAAIAAMTTPGQNPRDAQKLPLIGSFPPPNSASKDNSKKRPRIDKQTPVPTPAIVEAAAVSSRALPGAPVTNSKRTKLNHKPLATDLPAIEPTLTPIMPEPVGPSATATSSHDEIAFFDRVKKYLSNKTSYNEFLKVCNLFSQQIIDRPTVYQKGSVFLAANPELLSFWKQFLNVDSMVDVVDNRPAPPTGKVSLSNCRGYGPSYRLLPKRETLKRCSGRDELCADLLNDQWASHPTWASEDSGFVAHRKNGFEEGLHRIEEERHDYDFNIEANIKCIQLLEPVAQQINVMSDAEREGFEMPAALRGGSIPVFKRICKKIYGLDKGPEVVNDMFANPLNVVPVVLARMKQKDEEWRFSQREWEKVWHSQTENMHLKSLDHMGIQVKQTDKRNLSARHLVDVIKTKHEEQRRQRSLTGKAPRHQFVWNFSDKKIIVELLRLMMLYAVNSGHHSIPEKERITDFFESFVPAFFDIPEEEYDGQLPRVQDASDEDDAEESAPAELTNGRNRRNGKKSDLLRGVLDPGRNGSKPRGHKEDSAASASKETTPDVTSANEEEMPDAPSEHPAPLVSNERWLSTVPQPIVTTGDASLLTDEGELRADGLFTRPWYNFFSNQTIFVFFSVLQTLYKRLSDVKESARDVHVEVARLNRPRVAREIGLSENPMDYFEVDDDIPKIWSKTVDLIEEYVTGEIDEVRYQDVLRHYYLRNGWKLYTIPDLLKTLSRLALTCSSTDTKEKTPDLIHQYLSNREKDETNWQTEIAARKFAEKCVKDGEMFVISWFPNKSEASVRWLQKEDTTFYMDELKQRERWQYYISSYMSVEPTEGVPRARLQKTVLARNLPPIDEKADDNWTPAVAAFSEGLAHKVCLNSLKIVYKERTSECFIYDHYSNVKDPKEREKITRRCRAGSKKREEVMREKYVLNSKWMKDLSQSDVEKTKNDWNKWLQDGVAPPVVNGDNMDTTD
ncbi:hypothetical protein ACHAPP_006274 [Verticillium nonalfalfae]